MKKLLVRYTNDSGEAVTLYDGEITEIGWTDGADSLRVEAKTGPRRARQPGAVGGNANAGMNLLEMLAGAARSRNAAAIEEKKAELQREKEEAAGEAVGRDEAVVEEIVEVQEEATGEVVTS